MWSYGGREEASLTLLGRLLRIFWVSVDFVCLELLGLPYHCNVPAHTISTFPSVVLGLGHIKSWTEPIFSLKLLCVSRYFYPKLVLQLTSAASYYVTALSPCIVPSVSSLWCWSNNPLVTALLLSKVCWFGPLSWSGFIPTSQMIALWLLNRALLGDTWEKPKKLEWGTSGVFDSNQITSHFWNS